MDAGRRWSLTNSLGNPIYPWNDRDFRSRMEYDELQRNTGVTFVKMGAGGKAGLSDRLRRTHPPEAPQPPRADLAAVRPVGLLTNEAFDFKGNPLRDQPADRPKTTQKVPTGRLDWAAEPYPPLYCRSGCPNLFESGIFQPIRCAQPPAMAKPPRPTAARRNTATTRPIFWKKSRSACGGQPRSPLLSKTSTTTPKASVPASNMATG